MVQVSLILWWKRSRTPLTEVQSTGYVERFVFETSKISQLFCHQIIWNMKANCFKDDAGEVVIILTDSVTVFRSTELLVHSRTL
jgi:hypothetical protein